MQQTLCPFSTYSCPEQRQDTLSPSTQARSTSVRAHSIFCDSSDRPVPKLTGVNVKFSFNEGKHCLSFLRLVLHRNVWNRHPNLQSYGSKGIPLPGVAGPIRYKLYKKGSFSMVQTCLSLVTYGSHDTQLFSQLEAGNGTLDGLWMTHFFHSL